MDDDTPVIYGLEFQARALTSQLAESDSIKFLVGTQSLKLASNQVHVIEFNEETGSITTDIYSHNKGEIWNLCASPTDARHLATCYNTITPEGACCMRSTIWKIPDGETDKEAENLEPLCELETEKYGADVKTTVFHPTDGSKAVTVVDNHFLLWDLTEGDGKLVTSGLLEGKGQPRFTTGKWNPHHNCSQFVTANDGHVRAWDLRQPPTAKPAWRIEAAHSQLVRDLDFNPNRQYYAATCGDDGNVRFWDVRNVAEPVLTRSDHSHWVWSVRYNHFHDQLVLTSSSDARVVLVSVASIASEPYIHSDDGEEAEPREKLTDGILATYDEHEDSVYSVEWSAADPWTFASLSYDGRLVINKVPKTDKYKILL